MKKSKKCIVFLMCICICLTCIIPAFNVSAADDTEDQTIEGTFTAYERITARDFVYTDEFFLSPPDKYDHDFARLSLGLSLSAFRDVLNKKTQDDNLIYFLQNAGFTDIETETYRKKPTADSIGYGLAQKKIGDTTVMVCAVCGGNYSAEWASNLTIGDLIRAEGFQDAAVKVKAAIDEYYERLSSKENVRLWITGFSRGGAVVNITAADCTASGAFDAVYAYTFATPRTTREPVAYANIFNIMQKEDVIPKVPLADWGYERYGVDLFIVSPETDLGCGEVMEMAHEIYRGLAGADMVTNSEINYQLRILIDYLLNLMPEPATYTKYLQPLVIDIMTSGDGTMDALTVLLEALKQYSAEDKSAGEELKALRDYLGTLLNKYLLQGKLDDLPAQQWDPQFGIENLFNGHNPFEYFSMMYASDDPDELFSDSTDYIKLIVYADADLITIYDGDKVVKEITEDGREMVDGVEDPFSYPDAEYYDNKAVITLPADHSMKVSVRSGASIPQTVSYTGLLFSGNSVKATPDDMYSYLVSSGDTVDIVTSEEGRAIEPTGSDYMDVSFFADTIYSPTTAMRLENNSVVHLTISGLVNRLLLLIVILVVQGIVSLILTIIRKVKHKKRNRVVALVWHTVIAALFAILEVAMWYFVPVLPIIKMITGILVFIVIAIYAWKGCHTFSKKWKLFWLLIAALAFYLILESMLIGDFTVVKAILLLVVYAAAIACAFILLWKDRKEEKEEEDDSSDDSAEELSEKGTVEA